MSLFHCQVAPQHRPVTQPAATVYHLPRSRNFLPSRASADSEQAVESRQEDQPDTSGSVQLTDDRPERREASGLRLQKVERLGPASWAGVAAVDRGPGKRTSWRARVVLYRGDGLAILSYALIGQLSHTGAIDLPSALGTSAPFLIGWLVSGQITDVTTSVDGGRAAAVQAARCWAFGIPAGLALRALYKGHLPEASFAIVTLVYTFVTLVGWRAAYATVIAGKEPAGSSRAYPARRQSNSTGNPLEFLQLLTSLIKRW